ncbi:DUF952 domain-containing protein [Leptothermofonsia sichuanensis E412]|nr:DUF952 domain-containing protein [Leptothermofonsia sichuanensis E412]
MNWIFHITPRSHWEQAQQAGSYRADSLDTEGFIHCSTPAQVVRVADLFYRGQSGLVLLCIDPERLNAELIYEEVEEKQRFPHLYGALNLDAVVQVVDFQPNSEGRFELPAAIG